MRITEVIYRECCQDRDISRTLNPKIGRCKHCGREFEERRYTDAAGDSDWKWVPLGPERHPAVH